MNNFNEEMLNETDEEFDLEEDLWQEPELWDEEEWIPEYDEEEELEDSGILEEEELTEAEEMEIVKLLQNAMDCQEKFLASMQKKILELNNTQEVEMREDYIEIEDGTVHKVVSAFLPDSENQEYGWWVPMVSEEVEKKKKTKKVKVRKLPRFWEYIHKVPYSRSYAVELAIYTGMRIGELSGLRWENVYRDKGYILINSSEKYNEKTKCWYMAETKTGKERRFPISDEIRLLLDRVKKAEMKYGYVGEFVFQNENGQVNTRSIAHCIRYRCKKAGIEEKCIHAVRRTFNSKMKLAGASSAVAASLLGHSERINENNYTYDISQMEYKKEIVSEVSKINAK